MLKFVLLFLISFDFVSATQTKDIRESTFQCSLENGWSSTFSKSKSEFRLYSEIDKENDFLFSNTKIVVENAVPAKFSVYESNGTLIATFIHDGKGSNGANEIDYPYNMQLRAVVFGSVQNAPAGCISDIDSALKGEENN